MRTGVRMIGRILGAFLAPIRKARADRLERRASQPGGWPPLPGPLPPPPPAPDAWCPDFVPATYFGEVMRTDWCDICGLPPDKHPVMTEADERSYVDARIREYQERIRA